MSAFGDALAMGAQLTAENRALRAENERLKRSDRIGSDLLEQTRADLHKALTENERLRVALAEYVTGCHACHGRPDVRGDGSYECRECLPAREALGHSNCQ